MSPTPYHKLVEAAGRLQGLEILELTCTPSMPDAASFLLANHAALTAARDALNGECCVPLVYETAFLEQHSGHYDAFRKLAKSFELELECAEQAGALPEAAEIGLDLLRLANGARRGGLMLDVLVANAIESLSVKHLRNFRLRLPDASRLATELQQLEIGREPFDEALERDIRWDRLFPCEFAIEDWYPVEETPGEETPPDDEEAELVRQLLLEFAARPPEELHALEREIDNRFLALWRMLAMEFALDRDFAVEGRFPQDLSDLVARGLLAHVPRDPFSGTPFRYHTDGRRFHLSSCGPSGRIHEDRCGHWLDIREGDAHLCLNMFDFEACSICQSE